jgi:glycosyltransferase involved in cell wall biosynthesis
MSRRIEVIFCTDGVFPHSVGGMQRHSRLLAEKLAGFSDIDLTVVHPHHGVNVFDNPRIREIDIKPVKSTGRYLPDCYNYSRQVYKVVESRPHALIYSQGLSVWYRIDRVRNRIILNPHGLESYQTLSTRDYLIGAPFRMIFNYLFRKSGHVVSLGGKLTEILSRIIPEKKIVVLPNAINLPGEYKPRKFDRNKISLLFVGRFALNKGINILADAVVELNREGYGDQLEFNLVGKGPLFEEYCKKYNEPNLHFLGFADDDHLQELYKTNDLFVLPTLFEGMPTVVLEAMAHGMSVAVTDVGATREMVNHTNGFIIEKNSVASLKEAILRYLNLGESEKQLLSKNSFQRVSSNFTWDIVAERHRDLFRSVADKISGA